MRHSAVLIAVLTLVLAAAVVRAGGGHHLMPAEALMTFAVAAFGGRLR